MKVGTGRPIPRARGTDRLHKLWVAVFIWWATLVTILSLTNPILAIGMAFGYAELGTNSFIAYVAGTTGGSTLLAIPAIFLFRRFSQMPRNK